MLPQSAFFSFFLVRKMWQNGAGTILFIVKQEFLVYPLVVAVVVNPGGRMSCTWFFSTNRAIKIIHFMKRNFRRKLFSPKNGRLFYYHNVTLVGSRRVKLFRSSSFFFLGKSREDKKNKLKSFSFFSNWLSHAIKIGNKIGFNDLLNDVFLWDQRTLSLERMEGILTSVMTASQTTSSLTDCLSERWIPFKIATSMHNKKRGVMSWEPVLVWCV